MGSVDEEEPKTRWEKIFEEGKEEEKFVIGAAGKMPDWVVAHRAFQHQKLINSVNETYNALGGGKGRYEIFPWHAAHQNSIYIVLGSFGFALRDTCDGVYTQDVYVHIDPSGDVDPFYHRYKAYESPNKFRIFDRQGSVQCRDPDWGGWRPGPWWRELEGEIALMEQRKAKYLAGLRKEEAREKAKAESLESAKFEAYLALQQTKPVSKATSSAYQNFDHHLPKGSK